MNLAIPKLSYADGKGSKEFANSMEWGHNTGGKNRASLGSNHDTSSGPTKYDSGAGRYKIGVLSLRLGIIFSMLLV
jgi:hypothetical protein